METMLASPKKSRKKSPAGRIVQPRWQRLLLLIVLAYEGAGALLGGGLLIAAPDGRYMNMPVRIMHGVFPDFLIPGIILFCLGMLNAAAFVSLLRKSKSDWMLAGLSMGGLLIWFLVEIYILQELHWLHGLWGLPVVAGTLAMLSLLPVQPQTIWYWLIGCGAAASLWYMAVNIRVPLSDPGYSSFSQTVSELSAIGAPTRTQWVLSCIPFTLLEIAFGWGVAASAGQHRTLRIAGVLLMVYGFVGAFWPPMHPREVLAAGGKTMTDTLHIAFTAVTGFVMMLAMGVGGGALGKRFRMYSFATIAILLVFGALTAMDAPQLEANQSTPWMGIWERINIYATMLWQFLFAIALLQRVKKAAALRNYSPAYPGRDYKS